MIADHAYAVAMLSVTFRHGFLILTSYVCDIIYTITRPLITVIRWSHSYYTSIELCCCPVSCSHMYLVVPTTDMYIQGHPYSLTFLLNSSVV